MRIDVRLRRASAMILSLAFAVGGIASGQQPCPGGNACGGAVEMSATFTDQLTSMPPAWMADLTVPAFDDTLGTLVGARVRAFAPADAFFGVENTDGSSICPGGTWLIDSFLDLSFVQGGVPVFNLETVSAATSFGPLAPFDGVLDFGGSSGQSYGFSNTLTYDECFSAPGSLDAFRASLVGPQLTFTGQTSQAVTTLGTGCQSLNTVSNLDVGVEVEVTYTWCVPVGLAYCFGDATGTACPCANDGAPGHGCTNSAFVGGCVLSGSGNPSVGMDTLALTATDSVPGQPGLFFQGDNAVNGGNGVIFGDGLRCAGSNVVRLQVVLADGAGVATSSVPIAALGGASGGDLLRYQWWYRDPGMVVCFTGFNLSNGFEVSWAP